MENNTNEFPLLPTMVPVKAIKFLNGAKVPVYERNRRTYVEVAEVSKCLGYKNSKQVYRHIQAEEEWLKTHGMLFDLDDDSPVPDSGTGGMRECGRFTRTRYLDRRGAIWLCFQVKNELAKEIQVWATDFKLFQDLMQLNKTLAQRRRDNGK